MNSEEEEEEEEEEEGGGGREGEMRKKDGRTVEMRGRRAFLSTFFSSCLLQSFSF